MHGIELVTTARLSADGDEQSVGEAVRQVAEWRPEPDPFAPRAPASVGPDAVVVWTSSPRLAGRAAVLLRASDWEGQMWLDTAAAGELVAVGEQAEALAGARMLFPEVLVSGDLIATTPDLAAKAAWVDAYLARYSTYDALSSFAADAVDVLAAAAQAAGSTGRETLRNTLETLDHPGGLSGHIAFSAGNHSGLQPNALVPLVFVGDVWRPAGRPGSL